MPKYTDAFGYLNELEKEINESWFRMIYDLVTVTGLSTLDEPTRDILFMLYTEKASYLGIKPAIPAANTATSTIPVDFLEQLSGFSNFKLLGNELDVNFKKRITLVFGANGSGKSSLCESLKILATSDKPNRPLNNLRSANAGSPTFRFKFKSDTGLQTWTPTAGYGPRKATVKYFDTSIAIQNVTNPVEPGRVIVLTPFKLHVFEWAKELTTKFRESLQRAQMDNSTKLTQALQIIRTDFAKFKGCPLALLEDKTAFTLEAQIKIGKNFRDKKILSEKQTAATELEKATSEEGLKLLGAEHRELESFLISLNTLLNFAATLWNLEPVNKAKALSEKQIAQEVLANALIPADGNLESLLGLLRAASPLCQMDRAIGHVCPLCRRELGASEVDLFKQYHNLLIGELEKEIISIKADIAKAREIATAVKQVDRKLWEKCKTIPEKILADAMAGSDLIIDSCDIAKDPTAEGRTALEELRTSITIWTTQLDFKTAAIDVAAKGRNELVQQLLQLRAEIEPLEYAQAIADHLDTLEGAQCMIVNSQFWNSKLPTFTQLLRRITEKAKAAHEELVVTDFEFRLDTEYKALTDKDMASFGVVLARKGVDATVTVLPQIGGNGIESVLSEGELRVHALALFFAELETGPKSVLVFDDPISSFDYNYIANYCIRLRDVALKNPDRQIIVLTHNWEFFVQLQLTLHKASLNNQLSVQVLENCSVVADYSEKPDELKTDINAILATQGEPSKALKEEMAGKMRRLIEAIINTNVFNQQRHQYKQKTQAVSDFQKFTKLVRLLPTEATTLNDLYSKLSISEHDDPRNAYINIDKATFKSRYDLILAVETAIISRR